MPLRFTSPSRPTDPAAFTSLERAQVVALGPMLDGEALGPEERCARWSQPERWLVVDAAGASVFDVWIYGVDSGIVFHAGTAEIVAPIVQFGFACNDLEAWSQLAEADRAEATSSWSLRTVDFSMDPDAGPSFARLPLELAGDTPYDCPTLELGSPWPAVVAAVAPWDPDAVLRKLLTASSRVRRPGLRATYGAPAIYEPAAVRGIAAALAAVPADVTDRAAAAIAAVAVPGADAAWCNGFLADLRELVAEAEAAGETIAAWI